MLARIDRRLIEWGRHRDATTLLDGLNQRLEIVDQHARVECLLDVPDILALPIIRMNKRVDIPELQFDSSAHVVVADYLGEVLDDLQTPLEIAPMIVRHLEDEEFFEYVAINSQGFTS